MQRQQMQESDEPNKMKQLTFRVLNLMYSFMMYGTVMDVIVSPANSLTQILFPGTWQHTGYVTDYSSWFRLKNNVPTTVLHPTY